MVPLRGAEQMAARIRSKDRLAALPSRGSVRKGTGAARTGRSLFPASSPKRKEALERAPDLRLCGGRYWVRTSDLFGVNEARYHCANRPSKREPSTNGRRACGRHRLAHGSSAGRTASAPDRPGVTRGYCEAILRW